MINAEKEKAKADAEVVSRSVKLNPGFEHNSRGIEVGTEAKELKKLKLNLVLTLKLR